MRDLIQEMYTLLERTAGVRVAYNDLTGHEFVDIKGEIYHFLQGEMVKLGSPRRVKKAIKAKKYGRNIRLVGPWAPKGKRSLVPWRN